MTYYNRPILVKNALNSIIAANKFHQNWQLVFGDDGSSIAGRPIVEDILGDFLTQISFINSNRSIEEKVANGLVLGKYANEIIKSSDADVAFILCDDDEILPDYMFNLSKFFLANPSVMYCYSGVHLYNPILQKSCDVDNVTGKFNQWNIPVEPVGKLDASQVAWRLNCCKEFGAWFAESTNVIKDRPWTSDTDRSFFEQLTLKCGLCVPTGFVGQYKAIHDHQLVWHKNASAESLKNYDQKCKKLAGVVF